MHTDPDDLDLGEQVLVGTERTPIPYKDGMFFLYEIMDVGLEPSTRDKLKAKMHRRIGKRCMKSLLANGEECYSDDFVHSLSYTPQKVFYIFDVMMLFVTELDIFDDDIAFGLLDQHREEGPRIGAFRLSEIEALYGKDLQVWDSPTDRPLASYWLGYRRGCTIDHLY